MIPTELVLLMRLIEIQEVIETCSHSSHGTISKAQGERKIEPPNVKVRMARLRAKIQTKRQKQC